MKTKLFLITIMLLSFQEFVSGQDWRYADLRVQFVSPSPNTSFSSPDVIHFQFQIVNQGPDTIFTTDTIIYEPSHSYSGFKSLRKKPIPSIIAPMDSITFEDTIQINSRSFKKSFELSFSQVPMVYGLDFGKLKLVNEFSEDREDNYSSVKLFHIGNLGVRYQELADQMTLYPNPVNNNYVEIKSDHLIQSVTVLNSYSQLVPFSQESIDGRRTRIEVPNLAAGVYVVQVQTSESAIIKQIIIE